MADVQKAPGRTRMWIGLALSGVLGAVAGALVGWRPAAPSDPAESPEVARQIAQFRSLRDDVRRDIDELHAELARRAAAGPAPADSNPPPAQRPALPMGPDAPPAIDKSSAENPVAAAPLVKLAEQALGQADVAKAIGLLQQAVEAADTRDRSQVEGLLEQSRKALPKAVLAKLQLLIADADDDQIERWIASSELPAEWTKDFSDSRAADAFRHAAVKLLPIARHNREGPHVADRILRSIKVPILQIVPRFVRLYFFTELMRRHREGRLDAAAAKEVAELYGTYGIEAFLPVLRGLLVAGVEADENGVPLAIKLVDCEDAAVRGEFDLTSCAAMFDKCRRLAPEHFQPIDAPHPLNGRWRGTQGWQFHVDLPKEQVKCVNAGTKSELILWIIKIDADRLVGIAAKVHGGDNGFSAAGGSDPYDCEELAECDKVPHQRLEKPIAAVGATLLIASPKTKTMDAYRRLEVATPFLDKLDSGDAKTWRELSDVKHYRLFERYRQATASASR